MKSTYVMLAFVLMILWGCSNEDQEPIVIQHGKEDSQIPESVSSYFLNWSTDISISVFDYPFIQNGDTVINWTEGLADLPPEGMKYEVLEESKPGALQIDPDTGVITIKDATLFIADENDDKPSIHVNIKISYGDFSTNRMMYFKVLDSHTCIGSLGLSYNFMDKLKGSTWDDILFDSVENTFELHEDMNLCSLNYYCWITSTDLTFELLDEDGTKIFSQIVNGEEDGWGGMNFYLNELNYPLKAKTKYVLVCSSNVAKSNWFLRTSNESLLSFPIDLGHWSLLDASISKDGVEYPKTGFVPIQLGFVD